jgi:hypothetical protein
LLAKARESLKSARSALEREDYPLAWAEARRVGRPLRILMFSHFAQAMTALVEASLPRGRPKRRRKTLPLLSPVSCPPILAFNTLPQHYLWTEWIGENRFGANLLEDGSFEDPDPDAFRAAGWADQSYPADGLIATIATSRNSGARAGGPCASGPSPTRRGARTGCRRSRTCPSRPSARRPWPSAPGNWSGSRSWSRCPGRCPRGEAA